MSMDGHGTKQRRNITENVNRLSRSRYRRQTDDRRTGDSIQHSRSLKVVVKFLTDTKFSENII